MSVKSGTRPYRSSVRAAAADETRARIVAAARALLIGGEDLPAFSIDGVARQAGVTRLTVYNRFESKRGLLEAVFDDTAERGGLSEVAAVFAEADVAVALRRFVSVFCRFWDAHGALVPKFRAVVQLDDEVAVALEERSERRRHALTQLIGRLRFAKSGKADADLVDVLFALTSFETYQALSVRNRNPKAVEALVQGMVEDAIARARGALGS